MCHTSISETELLFCFVCNTKHFPGMVSKVSWLWWKKRMCAPPKQPYRSKTPTWKKCWKATVEQKTAWIHSLQRVFSFFEAALHLKCGCSRKIFVSMERLIRAFLCFFVVPRNDVKHNQHWTLLLRVVDSWITCIKSWMFYWLMTWRLSLCEWEEPPLVGPLCLWQYWVEGRWT